MCKLFESVVVFNLFYIFSDANSDNSELSRAANNLEHVVERIVSKEEQKRTYL